MKLNRSIGILLIILVVSGITGCAKYRAKSAFAEAETLAMAEQFDQAVEKYSAAAETDPSNMTYKIKLTASRTRAAAHHIRKARELIKEDKLEDALNEYRLARSFDPSLDVAINEEYQIHNQLRARTLTDEGFTYYQKKNYPAASKAVNEALKLDSQNARSLELLSLLDSRAHAVVFDGIELDIASTEPITLRFRQTNIREALTVLSKLSGINFILDEEVRGKPITVLLEKGTFAQGLELILQMGGVEKKVLNSKTILIYPNSKDKLKQYQDQVIQTFYLTHIDAKKAINMLRTMLQLRKVYVHEERNALVIRDTPDAIRLAEQLLKAADRADSEVLFDVEVLAVREGDTLKFGPKLSTYGTAVGFSTSETPPGNFPADIIVQSLNNLQTFYTLPSAVFDFAKTLSSSEILASPKIRVKNNEKAKIHIGNRDPIVTTTIIAGTDQSTQNVQYVDSGIKLDIEPNVQLDGSVLAKITLEVSNAQRLDSKDTKGTSPVALTTTNAQTSLVLVNGVRTILGGLYERNTTNNKTTFPFLGAIPLIGSLLTSFDNADTKREILLSITPYVVKRVDVPTADVATIWSGGEDTLMFGPKFGAFSKALLSEVDETIPAAAPGLRLPSPTRTSRSQDARTKQRPVYDAQPEDEEDIETEALSTTPVGVLDVTAQATTVPADSLVEINEEPAVPIVNIKENFPTPGNAVVPGPEPAPQAVNVEGGAVLSFSGPAELAVGDVMKLEVNVTDINNLFSALLFINYDPTQLEFVSVSEGSLLGRDGRETVFSVGPGPDTGQLLVGTRLAKDGDSVSGAGTLFYVSFRGRSPGGANIEMSRVNFRDSAGKQIGLVPAAAVVTVK
jgi:general secretion pathway protein D